MWDMGIIIVVDGGGGGGGGDGKEENEAMVVVIVIGGGGAFLVVVTVVEKAVEEKWRLARMYVKNPIRMFGPVSKNSLFDGTVEVCCDMHHNQLSIKVGREVRGCTVVYISGSRRKKVRI